MIKTQLINDNFQNYKRYGIPKAQLVIADIPYNVGVNAYGSNPEWYVGGFNIAEYFHFCNKMLIKEPKEKGKAPAMIVFCAFDQIQTVISYGKKYGFKNSYPLFFIKNYSPQVLKANMRIVGATEFAVVLYRDKLPKFNNNKEMVFNWMKWERDGKEYPKIHPTQKPSKVIKRLIQLFTDEGDVVIDPVAGSGITLKVAREINRSAYGFEVDKKFYEKAQKEMLTASDQLCLF